MYLPALSSKLEAILLILVKFSSESNRVSSKRKPYSHSSSHDADVVSGLKSYIIAAIGVILPKSFGETFFTTEFWKPNLNEMPRPEPLRCGRMRRSHDHAGGGIFQLNGTNLERVPVENVRTILPGNKTRRYVDIIDWEPAPWLLATSDWKDHFAATSEGGIRVKKPGVYFIYANFVFATVGGECSYKLIYGDGDGDYHMCRLNENERRVILNNIDTTPYRPCYLGLAVYMRENAQLKLRFYSWERCVINSYHFKNVQKNNILGIIKQS